MFKENPSRNASICRKYIDKAVRGANIETTDNSLRKRIEVNPDTEHRMDIQGNEFAVIWDELSARFPNSKYKGYFPRWIMDKIEKSKRQDNKERES